MFKQVFNKFLLYYTGKSGRIAVHFVKNINIGQMIIFILTINFVEKIKSLDIIFKMFTIATMPSELFSFEIKIHTAK